jgi:hypothetical protein
VVSPTPRRAKSDFLSVNPVVDEISEDGESPFDSNGQGSARRFPYARSRNILGGRNEVVMTRLSLSFDNGPTPGMTDRVLGVLVGVRIPSCKDSFVNE